MKFNRRSHTRILDDLTISFDPTGSTVELGIRAADGTVDWYDAEWLEDPVQVSEDPPIWSQTAQTVGYFAGPDSDAPGEAVTLTAGRHYTHSRVSSGQDVIVGASSAIDVA